jgi:hypothetical protein
MAKAVITNFGGIMPAAMARALQGNAAQIARNLHSNVADFRPLNEDVVVASAQTPADAQTIYRLARTSTGAFNTDMTTGWIIKAGPMSFAKGPLNSDTTERTYYSFDDGSAPPRWTDTSGEDRKLGVPRPTVAAVATAVVVDEFTLEERATGVDAAIEQVVTAIKANLTAKWRGAPEPGTGTTGWVNYQDIGPDPAEQGYQARVWRTSSKNRANNGTMTNSYSSVGVESFTWVLDAALQPFWATSNASSPSWQGGSPGNYWDHICIAIPAYGLTYDVNTAGLTTALSAILMPGTSDGTKFLSTEKVTELVQRVVDYADPEGDEAKPKLTNLRNKFTEIRTLVDGGLQGSAVATMQGFYNKSEIQTIFTNELSSWAGDMFDAVLNAWNSSVPTNDYTGAGA